jgi:ribosome-binding protein aMBF1 (putative translation factor)
MEHAVRQTYLTLCVITHNLGKGEIMTKTWNEFSSARISKMSRKDLEFHELLSQQYQIATQILGARKKRDLTQLELAQLSGVQQADISRIENGQSFPTTETLAKLLLALQAKVKIELVS